MSSSRKIITYLKRNLENEKKILEGSIFFREEKLFMKSLAAWKKAMSNLREENFFQRRKNQKTINRFRTVTQIFILAKFT